MVQLGGSALWQKSTRCESHSCVEVARGDGDAAIRNSDHPEHHISFGAAAWRAFIAEVRAGDFRRH